MGSISRQLRNIFLWQGFAIGATGTVLGLVLGYSFAWMAGTYHLIPLDPQVYAVPYVPFRTSAMDGVWISLVAMGISLLATVVPARAAARLLPVEILRFE
jgi:lipoprotein-releasing system permease protein